MVGIGQAAKDNSGRDVVCGPMGLWERLNQTKAIFPGSRLRLRYAVREAS